MTQGHGETILVRDAPCAGCGCYAAKHFECNCGEVHSDYCVNCGRFVDADSPPVLSVHDRRCKHGAVVHDHPWSEKEPYMEAVSDVFQQSKTPTEMTTRLKQITESSDDVIAETVRDIFALRTRLSGEGAN